MPLRIFAALAITLIVAPGFASAGSDDKPLSQLLLDQFSVKNPLKLVVGTGHDAHFNSQPIALASLDQLNRGIASQLATFPLGSSSGGFTYTFDPTLGVYNRSAESFGPLFAERAITAGKGKVNFGINYQRAQYDSFEGLDLQGGDFSINLTHKDIDLSGDHITEFFEGDVIGANYHIDLTSETGVLFGTYGVSDRLDVGVAIPVVRLDMNVRIRTEINRLATAPITLLSFHRFSPANRIAGTDRIADFNVSGTASGLGDIVVRGKYNLKQTENGGLAIGVDLRLPTGDEDDLLGSGATQTKIFLIASAPATKFSPHANIGYTMSNGASTAIGEIPNEIDYTLGFDAALGGHVTLNMDLIGRTLLDANRIIRVDKEFEFQAGCTDADLIGGTNCDPSDPTFGNPITGNSDIQSVFRDEYITESGDLNILVGAVGVKVNIWGELLLSATALFGIGERGLQSDITPVFGLDYTF
jgi:hypothetical protein